MKKKMLWKRGNAIFELSHTVIMQVWEDGIKTVINSGMGVVFSAED